MTPKEIEAGQALTREMAKTGNLLKALDKYVAKPTVKEKPTEQAKAEPTRTGSASEPYPATPAKVPGRVSCNTRCFNADCYRTYDNGRKVRFQATQKWNPFSNTFEWDSGSCFGRAARTTACAGGERARGPRCKRIADVRSGRIAVAVLDHQIGRAHV